MSDELGRRKQDRIPIRLFVDYEDAVDLVGDYTENLSSGGTFIHTSRVLEVETPLHLVLSFPGLLEPVSLDAVVKWSRGGRQPGVGVEFLPCVGRARLDSLVAQLCSGDAPTVASVIRVLVAEANRHLAELICSGLASAARRSFGDSLTFASSAVVDGPSALSMLRDSTFDVVLVEMELPLINGVRVIDHARSQLGLVDLRIIAMSSGGEPTRSSALAAGANAYLEKPMQLRHVIQSFQELGVAPSYGSR